MELVVRSISGINSPLVIRVQDAQPGERVRIHVSAVDAEKQPWSNEQVFHADEHGVVDVATSFPESALWSPPHHCGLLWTMRPDSIGTNDGEAGAFELNGLASVHIHVKARSEEEGWGALVQRTIAREVEECAAPKGCSGFSPNHRAPGVLLLVDTPPATASASAAALAHHGFTVFYCPEIPADRLPELAAEIHEHERVDSELPLALVAQGRSCADAIHLASTHPDLIGPVVAHSPSDVHCDRPGFSAFMKSAVTGHPAKLWDFYQHAHAKATPLDLSGMTGPLLLTAGTDDAVWDSVGMSTNLEKAAREHNIEVFCVEYPAAGHASGYPFCFSGLPATTVIKDHGHRIAVGGDADANGRAAHNSREQVISFLSSAFGISD